MKTNLARARAYVGTTPISGVAQFAILTMLGLRPQQHVLEYGCGALHLARPLLAFLQPNRYCAVEPNMWLVHAAREDDTTLATLLAVRGARFVDNDQFDASNFAERFDFVFAHSVMSHMGTLQLPMFLARARKELADTGVIVASYRRAIPDEVGRSFDSGEPDWQYPGVTWFTNDTIRDAAGAAGLEAVFLPELRSWYSAWCPDEVHDWVAFR